MPDYKQGKIYAIRAHRTELIYIGSTTQTLSQRLVDHKSIYKRYINGKHYYTTSFEIIQHVDAYIELIEDYPCENVYQLRKREGELIRQTENCVNKKIECRPHKEWRELNKERLSQKKKEWYEQNKERITQKKKEYYEENKEQIKKYSRKYYRKYYQKNMLGLASFGL